MSSREYNTTAAPASTAPARSWLARHEQEADRAAAVTDRRGPRPDFSAAPQRAGARLDAAVPGAGRPLAPAERAAPEATLGRDFSQVRVHADPPAAAAAGRASANAFTLGKHIVFGAGQFKPDTPNGQNLLTHELAHTVQQGAGGAGAAQCRPKDEKMQGIGSAPPAETVLPSGDVRPEDEHILFGTNSAALPAAAEKRLAQLLEKYTAPVTVEINGYAGVEGDADYSYNLSAHRAAALKAMLLAHLPTGSQVVLYAHGQTAAFGVTEANQRAGVRVTLGVTPAAGAQPVAAGSPTGAPPKEAGATGVPSKEQKLDEKVLHLGGGFKLTPPTLLGGTLTPPSLGGPLPSPGGQLFPPDVVTPPINFRQQQNLGIEGPLDWPSLREPFVVRGLRLDDRAINNIQQNVFTAYLQLRRFGFPPDLALWGAQKGTAFVADSILSRENPNAFDRAQAEWTRLNPKEVKTPIVPLITPTTLNFAVKKLFHKDINFEF
jgi:outer membrane protein OmpA-like peptidoglycan-associated protein